MMNDTARRVFMNVYFGFAPLVVVTLEAASLIRKLITVLLPLKIP